MNQRIWRIITVLCLGLVCGLAVAGGLKLGAAPVAQARVQGSTYYVDDDTCPATGSGTESDPYCTIQSAVDVASNGDEIRVATGTYTGAQMVLDSRTGYTYTQVVFITESLMLRGGYSSGDWNTPHPITTPTIIDAEQHGRGISIVGTGSQAVTVDGFTITGGDYTGLGNPPGVAHQVCAPTGSDCGGGLFANQVALIVRNAIVTDNVAGSAASGRYGYGGGMYLWRLLSGSVIESTTVVSNSASGLDGEGGGILVEFGAGLTVIDSTIEDNYAPHGGGGMDIFQPDGPVVVARTSFLSNTEENNGGGALSANLKYGGEALRMERVRMSGNEAKARGAAIYLRKAAFVPTSVRLTNLLLSGNRSTTGSAIDSVVGIASGYDFDVSLAHVTAASNSVPTFLRAEPTYSGYGVTVTLTNTLVASATNAFVGTQGAGDGTLVIRHTRTLSHNVAALHYTQAGTPTFQAVDPLGGDPRLDASCHLQFGSAAIDAGVDAGVAMDIDGDARSDGIPDIGADEFTGSMIFVPLILKN